MSFDAASSIPFADRLKLAQAVFYFGHRYKYLLENSVEYNKCFEQHATDGLYKISC